MNTAEQTTAPSAAPNTPDTAHRLDAATRRLWQLVRPVLRGLAWLSRVQLLLTGLQWVLVGFVLAGALYTFATPPFEAHDELAHYQLVRVLANGGLPVQHPDAQPAWGQHASQPLLYYALASQLERLLDTRDFYDLLRVNPHARVNDWTGWGNVNRLLHDSVPAPLTGAALAVYLLRLLNVVIACGALWAVHRVGLAASPKRPAVALLAVAIAAFNPMFVYSVAQVGSLSLTVTLNSLLLWAMVRALQVGLAWRTLALTAVLFALGAQTHMVTLALLPPLLLVWGYRARKDGAWVRLAVGVLLLGGGFVLLAGWWYARNAQLYGDLLGLGVLTALAQPRTDALDVSELWRAFGAFRLSYWGLFGANNLPLGALVYGLLETFAAFALLGAAFTIAQLYAIRDFVHVRAELRVLVLLAGVSAWGVVGSLWWFFKVESGTGALLFPFVAAVCPLLAVGITEWVWWLMFISTPLDRSYVREGEAIAPQALMPNAVWLGRGFALLALLVPLTLILPAYTPPAPLKTLPASAQPVYARFGALELLGYDLPQRRYAAGELVMVTFYWRAAAPISENYTLSTALVGWDGQELGKVDSYPALGTLPTSRFVQGAVYRDTRLLRLADTVLYPQPLRVQATWWDDARAARLPITDERGRALKVVLLNAGAVAPTFLPTQFVNVRTLQDLPRNQREFDGALRLEAFALTPQDGRFIAVWQAIGLPAFNYTAFVHVLDAQEQWRGGVDVPPTLPTSYWQGNESFSTEHALGELLRRLPPGEGYTLRVGLYEQTSGRRAVLPSADENAYNSVVVLTFAVLEDGSLYAPELEALTAETTPEAAATAAPRGAPTP